MVLRVYGKGFLFQIPEQY